MTTGAVRTYGELHAVIENVAALLAQLHGAGVVHRNIKAGNLIYMLYSTCWRLLNMGIVAREGAFVWQLLTLLLSAVCTDDLQMLLIIVQRQRVRQAPRLLQAHVVGRKWRYLQEARLYAL